MGVYYPLILFSRETRKIVEQQYPGFTVDAIDENQPTLIPVCSVCNTGDHIYYVKTFKELPENQKQPYYAYGCSECHRAPVLVETKEKAIEAWAKMNNIIINSPSTN